MRSTVAAPTLPQCGEWEGAVGFLNYSPAHTGLRASEGIIHVEERQSRESEQPKRTQRSSWPMVLEWRERSSYLPTVFEIFF